MVVVLEFGAWDHWTYAFEGDFWTYSLPHSSNSWSHVKLFCSAASSHLDAMSHKRPNKINKSFQLYLLVISIAQNSDENLSNKRGKKKKEKFNHYKS
jgi:hypothetical protein